VKKLKFGKSVLKGIEMNDSNQVCKGGTKLVFACSGVADVGEIADRAARQIHKAGSGKMFCLAGIGGGVSKIIETAKAAALMLAIDGCPLNCAKNTLGQVGLENYKNLQLAEMGMEKGRTSPTDQNIKKAVAKAEETLA